MMQTDTLDRLPQGLAAVAPNLKAPDLDIWVQALMAPLYKADIVTVRRIAAFLGQVAFESAQFTNLQENLLYSASRICTVWPSHFATDTQAERCAWNPEGLANTVYANRMGNGPPESGDGWKFRGGGLIQLTGRTNYTEAARAFGISVEAMAPWVRIPAGAAATAAWYWSERNLNRRADMWDLRAITMAVSGDTVTASTRRTIANKAANALLAPLNGTTTVVDV